MGAEQIERRAALADGRLVHYTSAEAAYRIITGAQVWLRSAATMNDFSEISHGLSCLARAWETLGGHALRRMLERFRPGLPNEFATIFDGHAHSFRTDTYLASLSEHDEGEDCLGRLSMWRAYGGTSGVALVLNTTAFSAATDAMKAFSAPVFYRNEQEFISWFQGWAGQLIINEDALRAINPDTIKNVLFQTFRVLAMCTKHPGFREEREWRVFHSPVYEGMSPWLEYGIEIVRGLPQPLVKLNLVDDESQGVSGVVPRSLINRVIIGPCEYPLQVRSAMYEAMQRAGIIDIEDKLWMS